MPATIWYRILCLPIIQKMQMVNMNKYNFACCFIYVWNSILHITKGHMIKVFNKRVTRNISGPKTKEVTGDQVKITYLEDSWFLIHTKYCTGDQVMEDTIRSCVAWKTKGEKFVWSFYMENWMRKTTWKTYT